MLSICCAKTPQQIVLESSTFISLSRRQKMEDKMHMPCMSSPGEKKEELKKIDQ